MRALGDNAHPTVADDRIDAIFPKKYMSDVDAGIDLCTRSHALKS